ncbi:hypothetical protein [Citreimonas salinaria]|uniref:Uncharacterized protein n=1 Tax=Citreimonas salinaria TaxID=321339 RepID=A0A1H3KTW7_9RHOB|nr:hypothetical protein [Citreimonas salinaria]SDY55561.1 hypothetical protein SAMN05444340_110105 [Citreimonas salinaria]
MSRLVSITARTHAEAQYSDEVEVLLIHIDHPELDAPIRLSSDPTERLTTDPLTYGTRSAWKDSDPATEPFRFIMASFEMPGDQEDAPAAFGITIDLFDATLVKAVRSFSTRATAALAVVYASAPDAVEVEYHGLEVIAADYGTQVVIGASRKPIEEEEAVAHRITKARFPGMFR